MPLPELPVTHPFENKAEGNYSQNDCLQTTAVKALRLKALTVRNHQGLIELIRQQIGKAINFDELNINLVNEGGNTHTNYIHYSRRANNKLPNNPKIAFAVKDGLFETTMESDFPVIWDLEEVIKRKNVQPFALYLAANGIKRVIGISLVGEKARIGNIFFSLEKSDDFTENDIKHIQVVAAQLADVIGNIKDFEENARVINEKNTLLSLSKVVALVKDKQVFIQVVIPILKRIFPFNNMIVILTDDHQPFQNPYIVYFEKAAKTTQEIADKTCIDARMANYGIIDKILTTNVPVVWPIAEVAKRETLPWYFTSFAEKRMVNMAGVSIENDKNKIGALFFLSDNENSFQSEDLHMIGAISEQISIALSNISTYEEVANRGKERELLISLSKNLMIARDRKQFAQALKSEFSDVDFFDEAVIFFLQSGNQYDPPVFIKRTENTALNQDWISSDVSGFGENDHFFFTIKQLKEVAEFKISDVLKLKSTPFYLNYWAKNGVEKIAVVPIFDGPVVAGILFLLSKKENMYFKLHFGLINGIAAQISAVASNIIANEKIANQSGEINKYKQHLEIENPYLQEEIQTTYNYSGIIGTSNVMKEVFDLVFRVSGTQSAVLILGETGTGKELIARAIHSTSLRKDKIMVKVNCATLPANLIESELFGHERGSFTGATERRIGKFELANNSTIFLDEIGELSLDLQSRLLRALQEKEIERVGGKTTIKTDVRVIAATNRDLLKEVQLGNFRSDLYFRLNVFPITLPALKDRKADIPLLTTHFLGKYAQKLTLGTIHFTSKAMKQMVAYNWPGNIRELEHLVERSILLAKGNTIHQVYFPASDSDSTNLPLLNTDVKTIDEVEREHILSVLKMVNGKVSGVGGAAEILKIPATTLSSKIRRLNIKKSVSK
jgi:formate hydrogenlyase transcriptional activator